MICRNYAEFCIFQTPNVEIARLRLIIATYQTLDRGETMAVTQADIDGLTSAIASGERQVSIGGRTVTYRSIDDLLKARDRLQAELAAQPGTVRPKQTKLYYAGRGYDR